MKTKKANLWRLLPYLKRYRLKIILAIIFIVLAALLYTASPTLEGMITTQLFADVTAGKGVNFAVIIRIVITLLLVYLASSASDVIYQFLLTDAIQSAMAELRDDVENKIRRLPVSYFDTTQLGDILSRVTNDMETISNALQQSFSQILNAILSLTLAVIMMLTISPSMTVLALAILFLSVIFSRFIVRWSQPIFQKQQDALGRLNGIVQEKFTGFNEIRLFGQEKAVFAEFHEANADLCTHGFRAQFFSGLMSPIVSFVTYIGIGCIAIMGAFYAIAGRILVGQLQAFIRYIWQINQPLSQMTQLASAMQSAMAAAKRIFEFLDEAEESDRKNTLPLPNENQGNVSFKHVSFSYVPERPLLKDLNAEVRRGQMVAIVGPTGVGKTTLINLLMRFYDVTGGSIKIDGTDIRDFKRDDLRSLFGMVLQDTWLFHGTIRDNIAYGKEDATDDEIVRAAKIANVHHFITTLPDGYNMVINEEAGNISQGEKQLLTIARAVLRNPPILILDEATSSVDTRLEQLLQDAMQNIMYGRTSFVIAHRLSTIKNADLILVMKDGNIVEQGTHDELLTQHGYYEQLYKAQFGD